MMSHKSGKSHEAKRTIVLSGVNFFEGGPLSLMIDALLAASKLNERYNLRIIALVSRKELFAGLDLPGIELIEFPRSRESYFRRLHLEYFKFSSFARKNKVDTWLSLHDISPRLPSSVQQSVYFHNPAPFYKTSLQEFKMDPGFGVFSILYKYLYRINVRKNRYVIVQQSWLRDAIADMFRLPRKKILVAHPSLHLKQAVPNPINQKEKKITLLFPTFPRIFKNIEILGEAARALNKEGITGFEILVTLSAEDNKYAAAMTKRFQDAPQLRFIGRKTRQQVFDLFAVVDALVFPSKLETWGLPISEFKTTGKPMLLADLPYAHETVGNYDTVSFFNPWSPLDLAESIRKMITGENIFARHHAKPIEDPYAADWQTLFDVIIDG